MAIRSLSVAGSLLPIAIVLAVFGTSGAARSNDPVPVLVELFTSEGCSSCPPADALLIELTQNQPIGAARVIALGQHVDYWDRLGWKDPFSDAGFTRRQEAYAHAANTNRIYTPQVIVDGRLALVGSDRAALFDAIRRAAAEPKPAIALAWQPKSDGGQLAVSLPQTPAAAGAEVYLAVVQDGLATEVTRGENRGRELHHAAVTRELRRLGRTTETGSFETTAQVELSEDWNAGALRIVIFAQREAGRVLAIGTIAPR